MSNIEELVSNIYMVSLQIFIELTS